MVYLVAQKSPWEYPPQRETTPLLSYAHEMQWLTLTECNDKVTFQKTHRYFSMLLLHTLAIHGAEEVITSTTTCKVPHYLVMKEQVRSATRPASLHIHLHISSDVFKPYKVVHTYIQYTSYISVFNDLWNMQGFCCETAADGWYGRRRRNMNRKYNRTGSEKSSRILPGPMMLGWPSHRRATTASCIHVLAPNQKPSEP